LDDDVAISYGMKEENTTNSQENLPVEQVENQISEPTSGIKGEIGGFIWETIKVVVISLAIILPIRYYLVQPFFVKGASMEPNFEDGDYILIDEISYRFNNGPSRGDVVIFRYPQDPSQFFIKRVIGLPGETVQIKDNKVTIFNKKDPSGFVLDEYYLSSDQYTAGDFIVKLDENDYYVLGDNRNKSSDSRIWGPVNKTLITGKAFLRPWPVSRAERIPSISY